MPDWTAESEAAFDAYVDALIGVIGHVDRAEPLKDYCLGLLMPIERKSVEPLAAVTAPWRVSTKHQSLLHFVGPAPCSDAALLARVRDWVLPRIEQRGPIRAWVVDDTGFPKKGKHSVGARQYCGQLGKQDNCQIAVSLSIANDAASLPIAYELYLPHSWAEDPEQRKKAKIPAEITFRTKPQIVEQIRTAKAECVAPGVVLADAGYGADGGFRAGLSELGLTYVVGVQPTLSVWRSGESPLPPKPWSGRGRPPSRVGRADNHKPISAKALAEEFDAETWPHRRLSRHDSRPYGRQPYPQKRPSLIFKTDSKAGYLRKQNPWHGGSEYDSIQAMTDAADQPPSDLVSVYVGILTERAVRRETQALAARPQAINSHANAFIARLMLEIEKLKRDSQLLEQLLEELKADDSEDVLEAQRAARSSSVRSFEHRRPSLKPFSAICRASLASFSGGFFLKRIQYDQDG